MHISLATLVACMMAKRPENRPQDYSQLFDDLKVILDSLEANSHDSHMELFFESPVTESQQQSSGLLQRLFKRK